MCTENSRVEDAKGEGNWKIKQRNNTEQPKQPKKNKAFQEQVMRMEKEG